MILGPKGCRLIGRNVPLMVRAKSGPKGSMTNKPFYQPIRRAFVLNFKLIYREQPFQTCNRSINDST